MRKSKVFDIVIISVMAALAIIIEKFISLDLGFIKITMYGLPLIFVGVFFGPKMGLITGIVSGCVMQLTSKYGITVTSILWALAPIAWGGVSGIIFKFLKTKKIHFKIVIAITISSLFATFLNTIAMFGEMLLVNDEYYSTAMILTNLPMRIIDSIVLIIPYSAVMIILYKTFTCIK